MLLEHNILVFDIIIYFKRRIIYSIEILEMISKLRKVTTDQERERLL